MILDRIRRIFLDYFWDNKRCKNRLVRVWGRRRVFLRRPPTAS